MDDFERVQRAVDRAVDRHGGEGGVDWGELELPFQQRAQDMRELAVENGSCPSITIEDIEGFSEK